MERTTPITISDEEQPKEGATDGTRQKEAGEEQTVATEREKIVDMEVPEEQPPKEAGETTEAAVVVEHPVDTEDRGDPGAETEQPEPEKSGAEEPAQQQQSEPTN